MSSVLNPQLTSLIRSGAHCVVIGDGKSGKDALALLHHAGAKVSGYTDNAAPAPGFAACAGDFKAFLDANPSFCSPQLAVLSPGVPLSHPYCQHLLNINTPLVSEVELGLAFFPAKTIVLGVTGTNGKSTVTDATSKLLQRSGISATACGNIGRTVSSLAAPALWSDVAVVELSSYQLESMHHPVLDAAVILNLSPDHLARHGDLKHYFAAKWRISQLLKPNGKLALNRSVLKNCSQWMKPWRKDLSLVEVRKAAIAHDDCQEDAGFPSQRQTPSPPAISKTGPVQSVLSFERMPDTLCIDCAAVPGDSPAGRWVIKSPYLPGDHNAENLTFAYWLASQVNSVEHVFEGFCSANGDPYTGLPHRLEECKPHSNRWGARIINDSKSTNFVCTAHALRSCTYFSGQSGASAHVVLLAGGQLKENNIELMFKEVDMSILKAVVTFGPKSDWLREAILCHTGLSPDAVEAQPRWQDAIRSAVTRVSQGDTLLFSPGAASFDAFQNFEERGEQFKITINQLASSS